MSLHMAHIQSVLVYTAPRGELQGADSYLEDLSYDESVLAYTAPRGELQGADSYLEDLSYDGVLDSKSVLAYTAPRGELQGADSYLEDLSYDESVLAYTAPRGELQGADSYLEDLSYDGVLDGNVMRSGLGQLVDGLYGNDDFAPDIAGEGPVQSNTLDSRSFSLGAVFKHESKEAMIATRVLANIWYAATLNTSDKRWVGWLNETRGGQPLEIIFEFDGPREFAAIHIYTNNMYFRGTQNKKKKKKEREIVKMIFGTQVS
uniref:Discoidin domain-containing protein n=1 Tax=Timema bartmani TaxID=61472 RepID=A0A7R9I665_9NEOP|nr:unnamed protein product [Timema bartmani]